MNDRIRLDDGRVVKRAAKIMNEPKPADTVRAKAIRPFRGDEGMIATGAVVDMTLPRFEALRKKGFVRAAGGSLAVPVSNVEAKAMPPAPAGWTLEEMLSDEKEDRRHSFSEAIENPSADGETAMPPPGVIETPMDGPSEFKTRRLRLPDDEPEDGDLVDAAPKPEPKKKADPPEAYSFAGGGKNKCKKCGRGFASPASLSKHHDRFHSEGK